MCDADPFGLSGGTRGVDHIREVLGPNRDLCTWSRCRGRDPAGIQAKHRGAFRFRSLSGYRHLHPGVVRHEGQARLRIRRIERHVRAPGLEDAQHGDDHVQGALQAKANPRLRGDAQLPEPPSQLISLPVEIPIGEPALPIVECHSVRRPRGLGLEELVQARGLRGAGLPIVPFGRQLVPLRVTEQRQLCRTAVGLAGHPFQERPQVYQKACRTGVVEAASIVGQRKLELGAGFKTPRPGVEHQGIVRLSEQSDLSLRPVPAQGLQVRVHRGSIEKHEAVEQGNSGSHAATFLHLHQGCVLVLAHRHPLPAQLPEPRQQPVLPGGVYPHRQRVDEQPHHRSPTLQVGTATVPRRPENHVLFAAVAPEQQSPSALHQRVEGQPVASRQDSQAVRAGRR